MAEKSKPHRRKEMKITLKSQPLKSAESLPQPMREPKHRPQDFKKKGTRGVSWIG